MSRALAADPRTRAPDRSSRNRQIVEGALLADIAVVLLLGRIYLPIPIVRTVWRLLAAAPFVLLAQRQGIRITIMAGVVAYLLLTALVGPTLALTAFDTTFAAIIIATALRWNWPRPLIGIVGGLLYAACDIVVPTILFAIIFRVPVSTLVGDVRNGMRGGFRLAADILQGVNRVTALLFGQSAGQMPTQAFRSLGYDLTAFMVGHWLFFALLIAGGLGIANVFAYNAAADLVLGRLPPDTRAKQIAA